MSLLNCKIGAIILGAGKSTRMGKPKILLPLNKKPIFLYPCELVDEIGLNPSYLIGGKHTETMKSHSAHLHNLNILYNSRFRQGMSTSLKLGINALAGKVDAAFIFLADQPLVPKTVVQSLINHYISDQVALIVRPVYGRNVGHPVLVSKELFSAFSLIKGDEGGKGIIQKYKHRMIEVPFHHPNWGIDIDTPHDYEKVKNYIAQNPVLF